MKRKWIKYTLRAALILLGLWMLIIIGAFFYIKQNKAKIISLVKAQVEGKISGQFNFDDLSADFLENFPGIAVDLKNVHLKDSAAGHAGLELVAAKHVYIGFGIFDLITGKKLPRYLALTEGTIHLFADSSGYKNWNVLKKQEGPKENNSLKKLSFKNVDAIFEDRAKNKLYDVLFRGMKCHIDDRSGEIEFDMDNDALLKTIAFNTKMGSYLANKKLSSSWKIVYQKTSKTIFLHDQMVRINGQPYKISGDFILGDSPNFRLNVSSNRLALEEAASIFPPKTQKKLGQYKLSSPIRDIKVYLSGPMAYLSFPVANISFSVRDASLAVANVQFDHCSFDGFFNNRYDSTQPPSDPNSVLRFADVRGEWEKNNFDGKNFYFYNMIHPYLKCGVHFAFKLTQLGDAIASRRLDFNAGDGDAVLNYSGPLNRTDTLYQMDGRINIHNADINYNPRNLDFKNTDIDLAFEHGDMIVQKMNTEVNQNKIRIKGNVKDFLNFFNTDSSKANFEWNIYSPQLDLGSLASSLHRKVSTKKKKAYSFLEKLNDKIDRLFDDCNAYLNIQADKITYKNFTASNVKGKLALQNDMISVDNFFLSHAGGTITVDASSKDNGANSDLVLHSRMQGVNIRELFAAFNSFGMESLTSKNIDGKFSADIDLRSKLDENNNLYKPANKGSVNFTLQNGKLKDFKPLLEIDNNFLQKRNLGDIDFADLTDRLDINGNDITINRMEIKSTAVNMYVEGIYSFAGNTDISIQVPLHGQSKDPGDIPVSKGNDSKGGISVFLRAKDDKDGKLKIGYDLLGRFRNKK